MFAVTSGTAVTVQTEVIFGYHECRFGCFQHGRNVFGKTSAVFRIKRTGRERRFRPVEAHYPCKSRSRTGFQYQSVPPAATDERRQKFFYLEQLFRLSGKETFRLIMTAAPAFIRHCQRKIRETVKPVLFHDRSSCLFAALPIAFKSYRNDDLKIIFHLCRSLVMIDLFKDLLSEFHGRVVRTGNSFEFSIGEINHFLLKRIHFCDRHHIILSAVIKHQRHGKFLKVFAEYP